MDTRIAYLLLVHDDPPMAVRLCSQLLRDPSADIYLHVDKKSSLCFSGCISLDAARVHAVDERYVVSWAGFNMVLATLSLLRTALAAPHNYSYLVLLSGHDYPLRSPTEINRYFHEAHYRQHINRISILDSPDFYAAHITRYHFRDQWIRPRLLDKVLRRLATSLMLPLRRRLHTSVMPCHGSQWWALTGNCVEYLLAAIDADPDFARPYRHSFAPDEHFFHTLVQNSPYVVEAPPITPYSGRGTWKTANFHLIHPSLSKIYTLNDYEELKASECMFVRKVDTVSSTPLLDRIDIELLSGRA